MSHHPTPVAGLAGGLARFAALASTIALGAIVGLPAAAQIVVRDDLRREVRFTQPAQRVISLVPSVTETICALDACTRLVATDRYSDFPPEVRALPKAGGLDDMPVETIVRLRPDVVFAYRSARGIDRLEQLGLRVVAVDVDQFPDIGRIATLAATILGVPDRAVVLNAAIARDVDAAAQRAMTVRHGRVPSVYFEIDGALYAASRGSFIGELLDRVGTRNVVPASLGPFPRVNGELIVRADPDVLMVSDAEAARVAARPGWDRLRAVRDRRICTFGATERDTIVRPGPRVAAGMHALIDCLERLAR